MAINPIELNFQTGRNVYCIRISLSSGASPQVYNTDTELYEAYDVANWTDYAIAVPEVLPGYYRVACPTSSLNKPATEVFFERQGSTPATTDIPAIANGNSQGTNNFSTSPLELNYATGRTLYCIRASLLSGGSAYIYNTDTELYEAYNASNWTDYAITVSEVLPGYYRAAVPTGSLGTPATEIYFEQQGGSPATSDAPSIANGNSQGTNLVTETDDIGSNPGAIVEICNLALAHLGQKFISTLLDDTQSARLCNRIFENCRDEVLRGASWKFATVIVALTNLADESVVGWGYVYSFPNDCVFVRKVYADDSNNFELPFFSNSVPFALPTTNPEGIEYRVIYQPDLGLPVIVTNINPSYIEYTGRVVDPNIYDALFKKALSYKLASELSPMLNGDTSQRDRLTQLYMATMSEAAKANGIEDGVPQRHKSAYLDVR